MKMIQPHSKTSKTTGKSSLARGIGVVLMEAMALSNVAPNTAMATTPQEIMPPKLIHSLKTDTPVKLDFAIDQPKGEPGEDKSDKNGKTQASTQTNDLAPDPKNGSEEHWQQLFQTAGDALGDKTNGMVKVVVMDTDDQTAHQFIWQNILKSPQAKTEMDETGLAGTYVVGNIINGAVEPTCYILYRHQKSKPVEQQFIVPLSQAYGQATAANFLIGHEVAHCFDFRSRLEALTQQKYWNPHQASLIGIAPVAFQQYFGGVMDYQLYEKQEPQLAQNVAQRQYQEELADIFGVFWAWTKGMPESGLQTIIKSRQLFPDTNPHGTWFALENLGKFYPQVMSYHGDLQSLWLLATHLQAEAGVSLALQKGTKNEKRMAQFGSSTGGGTNFSDTPVFGQNQSKNFTTNIERSPSQVKVLEGIKH